MKHIAITMILVLSATALMSGCNKNLGKADLLRDAVSTNDVDAVTQLLNNGHNPNGKDSRNVSALHYAAQNDNPAIARLLIDAGAKLDPRMVGEATPLHIAAQNNSLKMVEFLIKEGCKIDAKDNSGRTALHFATGQGLSTLVNLLLDLGADINQKNYKDETSLHFAVFHGHKEMVSLLLTRKANCTTKTTKGKTAFALAVESERTEIADLLKAHEEALAEKEADAVETDPEAEQEAPTEEATASDM